MASREELLQLLKRGKKMDKDIAYKIYGYAVTWPEFEEEALSLMEKLYILYADPGDRNPRELYRQIMDEYERQRAEEMKPVAHWLVEQTDKTFERKCRESQKEGEEKRKIELLKREMELLQKKKLLIQKSNQ